MQASGKNQDQSGLVSFLVVSVIVTVLGLVTLGFVHLTGRESRQALDRQLSDVARYAAESGVNDALQYIKKTPNAGASTNCAPPNSTDFVPKLSGSNGLVQYSCLTIDPSPPEIAFNPLKAGESVSFEVTKQSLGHLFFSWENQTYTNGKKPLSTPDGGAYAFGRLPQENSSSKGINADATGLLEADIYPVPNGKTTNAALENSARHYFLYPDSPRGRTMNADKVNFKSNNDGSFVHGDCSTSNTPADLGLPYTNVSGRYCNSEVWNISSTGDQYFYVKLTAFYANLNVGVQTSDDKNQAITLNGVEAVVDSTGEGNDVLQRIKALVPININEVYSNQSMDAVCKLFKVPVNGPNQYGNAFNDGAVGVSDKTCSFPSTNNDPIL